jgi:hypothetical protein
MAKRKKGHGAPGHLKTGVTANAQQLASWKILRNNISEFLNQHPIFYGFVIVTFLIIVASTLAFLLTPTAFLLNSRRDSRDAQAIPIIPDAPGRTNTLSASTLSLAAAQGLSGALQHMSDSDPSAQSVIEIEASTETTLSAWSASPRTMTKTPGTLFVIPDRNHTDLAARKRIYQTLSELCHHCILILEGEWIRFKDAEIYFNSIQASEYVNVPSGYSCYFLAQSDSSYVYENVGMKKLDCGYDLTVGIDFSRCIGTNSFRVDDEINAAMRNFLAIANKYLDLIKTVEEFCRKDTGKKICSLSDSAIVDMKQAFSKAVPASADKIYILFAEKLYKDLVNMSKKLDPSRLESIQKQAIVPMEKFFTSLMEVRTAMVKEGDEAVIKAIESSMAYLKNDVDRFLCIGAAHLREGSHLSQYLMEQSQKQVNVQLLDPLSSKSSPFKPLNKIPGLR